jgi:hypothetical protein
MSTLWDLCETVFFPRRLETGPDTRRQYKYALDDFGRLLGRPAKLEDLTDDNLLLWTRNLMDRRLTNGRLMSPWTVNEKVGRVRCLWTFLFHRGMMPTAPTVKRIPAPDPCPRAWHEAELVKLFAGADLEGGLIAGIPARLWWRARLGFHWGTGERKGAADRLLQDWVNLERALCVIPGTARKGGRKPGYYLLPDWFVLMLREIWEPRRELVFPWDRCDAMYWHDWNRILKNAGLPGGPRSKTKALRISHASWRLKLGDDPTKALMHSDPETTRRHYLDRSFEAQPSPLFDPRSPPPSDPRAA